MSIYFSPSQNAFYDSGINTNVPSDKVEITQAKYKELLDAQSTGKQIYHDASGNPVNLPVKPDYAISWDIESQAWIIDEAAKTAAETASATLEARRAATQSLIESYISAINTTYGLSLTVSMDFADAVAAISASSMTQSDAEVKIPYLNTLYVALNSLGGAK